MTERKCILTGDRADPETLVRLAIGPDGQVLPDIPPGRWQVRVARRPGLSRCGVRS